MSRELKSFSEVVGEFESYAALARELTALGYPVVAQTVRLWKLRDNIPPGYWKGILELARRYELNRIRTAILLELAARTVRVQYRRQKGKGGKGKAAEALT